MAMLCNRGIMEGLSVQLSEDEFGQEHSEHHGSCEKDKQYRHECDQRQAAPPPCSGRVLQVPLQERHVPVVRFPGDIEEIPESGNEPYQCIEPKSIVGPRNDKGAIEQPAQCPELLDLRGLMSPEDR